MKSNTTLILHKFITTPETPDEYYTRVAFTVLERRMLMNLAFTV